MARIESMVIKLDNGKYRTIKLHKVKSIYAKESYICDGKPEPGHGDVAGPETDKPEFKNEADWMESEASVGATSGTTTNGNGNPPHCYEVNGVWICT